MAAIGYMRQGLDLSAGVESTETSLQALLVQFSETTRPEETASRDIHLQLTLEHTELEANLPTVVVAVGTEEWWKLKVSARSP